MQTVSIFVDVQNIYYTTRDTYSRPFNYRQFWFSIAQDYDIVAAYAYAIDKDDVSQQKFQSALRHIGFDVKLKPFIQRRDGSAKGDWDVGIALDVYEAAANVDKIILLSGDGDFDILVQRVQEKFNVKVDVYGVPGLTAQSLIDASDRFI
ncbi:MAG: NYN domain-containing protein, partial [Psychrobium sp.]